MSASLVGSEMCIRDRAWTSAKEREAATSWSAGVTLARVGERRSRPEPGAVSYTHLTLPTICSV
eukprot:12542923-Alexandrium_andersonii.AAC.1